MHPLVLSVCETAMGGVGRYQENLGALRSHGLDLVVLLPEPDAKILPSDTSIRTFRRSKRGMGSLFKLLQAFFDERRRLQPDLYFMNSTFSLFVLLALRLAGDKSPAVYCAHSWAIANYDPHSLKGRAVRVLEGYLCGLADLVVNVSAGDAQIAKTLGYRGRQIVIENAVTDTLHPDAEPVETPEGKTNIRLLFVGRFDRQKGLDILLAAFERARAHSPNLCLHLIGAAVRGGSVPHFPEGVTHHGWVSPDRIDDHYRAADLLLVPSRWEGLPLVVPEALRNGTPVWVSDRSDMGNLIEPGVSGDVFPLDVETLTDRLQRLQRTELQSMRRAARQSYEQRFTLDRFGSEMSAQLLLLLAARKT